jgi:hypothetical protein
MLGENFSLDVPFHRTPLVERCFRAIRRLWNQNPEGKIKIEDALANWGVVLALTHEG